MKLHNCKIITGIRIRHVLNWVDDNSFILTDRHTWWDLSSLLLSERGGSPHQLDDRSEGQAICWIRSTFLKNVSFLRTSFLKLKIEHISGLIEGLLISWHFLILLKKWTNKNNCVFNFIYIPRYVCILSYKYCWILYVDI